MLVVTASSSHLPTWPWPRKLGTSQSRHPATALRPCGSWVAFTDNQDPLPSSPSSTTCHSIPLVMVPREYLSLKSGQVSLQCKWPALSWAAEVLGLTDCAGVECGHCRRLGAVRRSLSGLGNTTTSSNELHLRGHHDTWHGQNGRLGVVPSGEEGDDVKLEGLNASLCHRVLGDWGDLGGRHFCQNSPNALALTLTHWQWTASRPLLISSSNAGTGLARTNTLLFLFEEYFGVRSSEKDSKKINLAKIKCHHRSLLGWTIAD